MELFQALGGQELSDPLSARTDVESLRVEPFVHKASDRVRAQAQDVGHPHDVLVEPFFFCWWHAC